MRIPSCAILPVLGPILVTLTLLALMAPEMFGQAIASKWQQVMRGDGFTVDVDATSLTLTLDGKIGATFRMVYSKSGSAGNARFKARIDRYEFVDRTYRTIESRFFDSNGREVSSSGAGIFRPVAGTAARFLEVARNLPPFGRWKVLNYSYVDGAGPAPADSAELTNLKNSFINIFPDRVVAGKTRCDAPSLEMRTISNDEVEKRLSTNLRTLGINANEVRVLLISCKGPTSLMFLTPPNKAILLWEGVLLSLEFEDRYGFTFPPITIK